MEKNQRNDLLNYFLLIFAERTENTHLLKQKMLLESVGFDKLLCLRMFLECCFSIKLFLTSSLSSFSIVVHIVECVTYSLFLTWFRKYLCVPLGARGLLTGLLSTSVLFFFYNWYMILCSVYWKYVIFRLINQCVCCFHSENVQLGLWTFKRHLNSCLL